MKYYAVKKGRKAGVYTSWDECKNQVMGFSGAKYKSFNLKEEADEYICEADEDFRETEIEAYVDGSFNGEMGKYAYGCVIIKEGNVIHKICGSSTNSNYVEMRNVAGELEAAVQAIKWAIQNKIKSIRIYHDYQGIASWANGEWKTNKYGTQEYATFIDKCSSEIRIEFTKVKGHSGQKYNEMADQLAKKGLFEEVVENYAFQYNEFMKTYKLKESQISYVIRDQISTDKSILDFVKLILKQKGYKKVTNIKIEYIVLEGFLKITFDLSDATNKKVNIKIFDLEGRNVVQ